MKQNQFAASLLKHLRQGYPLGYLNMKTFPCLQPHSNPMHSNPMNISHAF